MSWNSGEAKVEIQALKKRLQELEDNLSDQSPSKIQDVVVAVIRRDNGTMLLHQRSPSREYPETWEFPGGKVEPGEDFREALHRELSEELGISIDVIDIAASYSFQCVVESFCVYFYEAALPWGLNVEGVEVKLLDGIGVGWFSPEVAKLLDLTPGSAEFLKDTTETFLGAHCSAEP